MPRAEIFIILADLALVASGGGMARSDHELVSNIGLCALGAAFSGGCGFLMSLPGVRKGTVSAVDLGARSLANIIGGIPVGLIAGYYLPHWEMTADLPPEVDFLAASFLGGLIFVTVVMMLKKWLSGLSFKDVLSWLLTFPKKPNRNP